MSLKRKTKISDSFSMASMTDVIFLLLIFFMVTSTLIVPNAIKVNLPSSSAKSAEEIPPLRVNLTSSLNLYIDMGDGQPIALSSAEELLPYLERYAVEYPNATAAIYADESVPYKQVMAIIEAVTAVHLKLILVTRPQNNRQS